MDVDARRAWHPGEVDPVPRPPRPQPGARVGRSPNAVAWHVERTGEVQQKGVDADEPFRPRDHGRRLRNAELAGQVVTVVELARDGRTKRAVSRPAQEHDGQNDIEVRHHALPLVGAQLAGMTKIRAARADRDVARRQRQTVRQPGGAYPGPERGMGPLDPDR